MNTETMTAEQVLEMEILHNVYIDGMMFTHGKRDDIYGWRPIPAEWYNRKDHEMKNTTTHKAHLTTPYAIPTHQVIFYRRVGKRMLEQTIAGAYNVGDVVQVIVCGRVNNYLIIRG